jgi:phosphoglucosamine mutase
MKKLFGTDGIRAVAGKYPLDQPTIFLLGRALVNLLREEGLEPRVLIGRDTRESGPWIEQTIVQGIEAGAGEAVSVGVIPTSAVSLLTRKHHFAAGIVISASHNPYRDNGIKVFSSQGFKIPDKWEVRLEKDLAPRKGSAVLPEKTEPVSPRVDLAEDYMLFLKEQLGRLLARERQIIMIDCANGAAAAVAPRVFSELGFTVIPIHNTPDGKNINLRCGSLHPEGLAHKVVQAKADLGVAYDGDADRAIWVDNQGKILNGDHTLFVQARFMKEGARLKSDLVVATTMSNMGLEKALDEHGLKLVRTQVGDKYVLEKMVELGANLGGEQSGHTIFLDDCPTGDGLLTSLKMIEAMLVSRASLSELTAGLKVFPQVHQNVHVREKIDFDRFPEIVRVRDAVMKRLAGTGRLEVRYSGTEPLARIMVEGEDKSQIEDLAGQMAAVIAEHLGDKGEQR